LTPSRNECDPGLPVPGCQPGDLTKRMACPWQADFFQCTIEYINFSDSEVNKVRIIKTSKLIILHAKKHHFIDVMLIKRLGG
jgi:L-lysine 6-oxidase